MDPQRIDERAYELEFRYEEDVPTPEGRKRAARAWRHQQRERDEQEGPLWNITAEDPGPPAD